MMPPHAVRAACIEATGRVRIVERPLPDCRSDELVIRMLACGICASDLMDWYIRTKAPFVFGHEPVGIVTAAGSKTRFRPGQRVFVHHHAPCGNCPACRRGDPVHCPLWREPTLEPGGMSEFARVAPQAVERDVLVLPDHLDDLDGTLIEPVACAVKALRRARFRPEERVFIVGLGFMGRILGRLARAEGVSWAGGSDPLPQRRRLAEKEWADTAVPPANGSLDAASSKLDHIDASSDLVIVTPSSPSAIAEGLARVREGGRVLLFAPTPLGEPVRLPLGELFFREVELIPSYSAGPEETRVALALIERGVVSAKDLVSHVFPFSRVAEAYRRAADPDVMKVVVRMEEDPH